MIFGFGREPEREEPTAYEIAVAHYKSLRESMPSDTLRLQIDQPTAEFPRETYLLAKQENTWLLLPDLDYHAPDDALGQASIQSYAADRVQFGKEEPQREPIRQEGLLAVYAIQPVALTMTVDGGTPVRFTVANRPHTAAFLQKYLPACRLRSVYDILEEPADACELFCEQGGGLLPNKCPLSVWRADDHLHFLQQIRNAYYTSVTEVRYGVLPVSAIECFEPKGDIDYETKVSGGGVTVDRSAAYWAGWQHPFSLNPHGRAIEAAVSSEPIRTERVEHDNRYIELLVRLEGRRGLMKLSYASLQALQTLIPEKSFENMPGLREPTIAEQIEILANVCDRGYLTREEFDAAKAKLLARL